MPTYLEHTETNQTAHDIGIVLAVKPSVQLLTNIIVSSVIHQFGYAHVFIFSSFLLGISTLLMMCLMPTRTILLVSRCLQGIGSSFGTVSGLGMIGSFHYDENIKIEQMSKAMSGLAFGVLIGPPFSSLITTYIGLSAVYACLMMLIMGTFLAGLLIRNNMSLNVTSTSPVWHLLAVRYSALFQVFT